MRAGGYLSRMAFRRYIPTAEAAAHHLSLVPKLSLAKAVWTMATSTTNRRILYVGGLAEEVMEETIHAA